MTSKTNRRTVLGAVLAAGAVAASALPAAATAGPSLSAAEEEPDPVLGLVANLSAAWDRLSEALEYTTHFEDHPLVDKAHREIDAALAELQATPPSTLAGARAAIARLVEYDEYNVPEERRQVPADAPALADLRPTTRRRGHDKRPSSARRNYRRGEHSCV
jgi:hypothetical protein